MDILDENNDHADIEVLYEEQINKYDISDDTPSFSDNPTGVEQPTQPQEFNMSVYNVIKKAELDLTDELANLDYEGNPQGVIQLLTQLTAEVSKFNNR